MIRQAIVLLGLLALMLPAAGQPTGPTAAATPTSFAARFNPLAPVAVPLKATSVPTLRSTATIVGEIVRIGDLVENAGSAADIAIFRAPDLGQSGSVSVARVIEAVTPHDVVLDTRGFAEVMVTRASRTISPDAFEDRIARTLAARHRIADPSNITLTFDHEMRAVHVEPGARAEPRIVRMAFDPRSGRFDVVFELPTSTRRLLRFTGSFAETFEAAVLVRPIASGAVLKETDFNFVRRPKAEFAANVVTEPAQAVGLAARHPLRPGQVLRQTDLTKPEVIARNDSVTITYDVPGITLTLRGKAMEGGAQGEIINVLNVISKKTIQATVVGPGQVSVAAAMRAAVLQAPPRLAAQAVPRSDIHPHARARAE
jgi:flagella basal body P-ring formation protein FlgA